MITDVLEFRLHPYAIIVMTSRSFGRSVPRAQSIDNGHQSVVTAPGERRAPEYSILRVVEKLRSQGSTVETLVLPQRGDSGEVIQLSAVKAGGKLLVMGGFGHSGLREYLFGGTTADVIRNPMMSVLLMH